ncbi:MAG: WD40 repeat domain-containing protein [Treponema sp.]|nr:WD40 repeat domain-containing protein [Treponema sp.]
MARNKKYWLLAGSAFFVAYFFIAAKPVPVETILAPRWLSSLESSYPLSLPGGEAGGAEANTLIPFVLGRRFGYVDGGGNFTVNRARQDQFSISGDYWAEYAAIPGAIEVRDPRNELAVTLEAGGGYPLFIDGRIFLLNEEGNSLRAVDGEGQVRWVYDFPAPLTDIDAAAGLILAGSLDGTVELLDDAGKRVFFFEPGGSRLAAIYGCRISSDGSRLAIVSGYDDQRFLLLERFGDSYKVIFHEFLNDGFHWGVHLAFIDSGSRVIFERQGGLGIYDIITRKSLYLPLPGNIEAVDSYGGDNLVFVINAMEDGRKELTAIRYPGTVVLRAPFQAEDVFLGREGNRLYLGGGGTIASFELDKR